MRGAARGVAQRAAAPDGRHAARNGWRAALGVALLLWAAPAMAELREEMADLLRARGCAMEAGALVAVFTVMGRAAEEVGATLDAMAEAGEVAILGGLVRLSPALCRAAASPAPVPPLPWIEERLAGAAGCRMGLDRLGGEAEAAGVRRQDFDRAMPDLVALGRVVPEGHEIRLRPDLCDTGRPEDWQLDKIMGMGPDVFRALLGFAALRSGCRLALGDQEALLAELRSEALARLILGRALSAEAQAALDLRIGQALGDPGPAYRIEDGSLVSRYCLP